MQAKKWPVGAVIPLSDRHFHQKLYCRYNNRILRPGEYEEICRRIRTGALSPLDITLKDNERYHFFCYKRKPHKRSGEALYIIAPLDGAFLKSAYKAHWVKNRLKTQTVKQPETTRAQPVN